MQLRDYQSAGVTQIYKAWNAGNRYVMYVLPTGGGKTVIFSHILTNATGRVLAIAHRQELVSQISLALCKYGAYHNVIAPENVVRNIMKLHVMQFGMSYFNPNAQISVAGVDTLVRRKLYSCNQVKLIVMDEGHHALRKNKWGKAISMFPNARGLFVTATPERADGFGLGADYEGLINKLIVGPTMRELINQGHLSDYRLFGPPLNVSFDDINRTSTGDYSRPKLKTRIKKSRILGDIPAHYLKLANGLTGVTFATDVETAGEINTSLNGHGIPSERVSAKTPDLQRYETINSLKNGRYKQLVNVDLFGEGFDLPAIKTISMARPTMSYSVYAQQFGRALRPSADGQFAIIIDHVGNSLIHGLPDLRNEWSLAGFKRNGKKRDDPGLRACPKCTAVYEKYHSVCPYCKYAPKPVSRSSPEFVDGDLTEYSTELLNKLNATRKRIDEPGNVVRERLLKSGMDAKIVRAIEKRHDARLDAQRELRQSILKWAGKYYYNGESDSSIYRRFYGKFGIDVLSAQALGRPDAEKLKQVIDDCN